MNLPDVTPFLDACGATGPLCIAVASTYQPVPVDYLLHRPFAVIGRAPHADLVLTGPEISKRHAYLQILDGRAFLLDLNSRTGISVDGKPTKANWINPGQNIGIGPFTLSLPEGSGAYGKEFNPLLAQTFEPAGLPAVGLSITRDGRQDVRHMNCRLALIGASPLCNIRLEGSSVSKVYCSLVRTVTGLWVVDLLASGGIQVNGRQVRCDLLRPGDRLQVGTSEIEIVNEEIRSVSPSGAHAADASPSLPALRPAPAIEMASNGAPANGTLVPTLEAYAEPLLQQFDAMQQQMVSQFQQAMVRMVQMFGKMQQEEMAHLYAELNEMRQQQLATVQHDLKQLRQEEMSEVHRALTDLRDEERGRIHDRLQELREEERSHIHEGLRELRQEERGQIHEGLKQLRDEEQARIHERLKELREEERTRIHERLIQLREDEKGQIQEELRDLREEEKIQIHQRLKELREEERVQMYQELKGLRDDQMTHIQEELKELREEERLQIQEGLKELREEERAKIQQELKELHKVNHELQELRDQLGAAPVRRPTPSVDQDDEVIIAATRVSPEPCGVASAVPEPIACNAFSTSIASPEDSLGPPSQPHPPISPRPDHDDLHAKLCERMATLQTERQSRWRKILGLLRRGSDDRLR